MGCSSGCDTLAPCFALRHVSDAPSAMANRYRMAGPETARALVVRSVTALQAVLGQHVAYPRGRGPRGRRSTPWDNIGICLSRDQPARQCPDCVSVDIVRMLRTVRRVVQPAGDFDDPVIGKPQWRIVLSLRRHTGLFVEVDGPPVSGGDLQALRRIVNGDPGAAVVVVLPRGAAPVRDRLAVVTPVHYEEHLGVARCLRDDLQTLDAVKSEAL